MRSKKVTRYYCDFCNKASLRANSMAKHEKHCTLNPNRYCRVCTMINGGDGCDMEALKALLPDPTEFLNTEYFTGTENAHSRLVDALHQSMPAVREESDNCPACIMAALRQKKIPVPMVEGFDFKSEMQSVFSVYNDENRYY